MNRKKIMLVEDDEDTLLGLSLLLRKLGGYRIVAAVDASTAPTIARKEMPDLIILDVGLPGGNGIQVLRSIRNLVPLSFTPVIVLTAQGATLKKEALEAGANAFLQKPADTEELLASVRLALWD